MNYYAFSALIVFLSSILSGSFVLWKNPRRKENLVFQPFAFSLALWSFFYMLWQMSDNSQDALFFIRVSIVGAALIPATNYHAIIKILGVDTPRRQLYLKIFYLVTLIIVLSSPTKYFIPAVVPKLGFPYWPTPGLFIHLLFMFLGFPTILVIYLIWKEKEKASPLQRNKLKWLLYAHVIGYAGGMTNYFLWYDIPVKPYFSILSVLISIGTAVTFFRPGAVDFNFLIRRLAGNIFQLLLSCFLAVLVLIPFRHRVDALILMVLAAILGALIHPLWKIIFKPSSVGLKVTSEKIKESTYTYEALALNIVDLTFSAVPVEMVAIYFFDMARTEFYLSGQRGMKNPLAPNLRYNRSALAIPLSDPLIRFIDSTHNIVNKETLLNEWREEDQPLIESLGRLEAEICEPFIFGGKLRGLLVVGRKRNNTLFNDEELDMIHSHAQIGTEVMRTIMAMETELNQTALYSHDINHDIRSITQTLEFLRSPFAKNQPEEKLRGLIDQGGEVAQRLYEWFQANRDRSTMIMKTIRGEYEKKPLQLSDIMKLSAGKFSLQAEKAGLAYQVDISTSERPFEGNEADLTRLVDNLISNALRHAPETGGRIEITGRMIEKGYEMVIKDNGEGIDPEDLNQIWQMGWQGKNKKKGAAGFGLSIVKQIVQIHGGTIQALSRGKGTGTQFIMTLPL